MKHIYVVLAILLPICSLSQSPNVVINPLNRSIPQPLNHTIRGTIVSSEAAVPVPAATITAIRSKTKALSTNTGVFTISITTLPDTLLVTHVSYGSRYEPLNTLTTQLSIPLTPITANLESVTVSTGYQTIPRERATGAFAHINNQLLNRRVSTNIIDRLDGITPGLLFNRTSQADEKFSIRGRSTLLSATAATPLIVLDNFPYEGNISNINPNDVESITVLKDAAAASIWGARSANGVIVITSKKGMLNQKPTVEINANVSIGSKPDLFYSRNYITAGGYIDAEKFLFDKGFYNANSNNTTSFPALTPAVEILLKKRGGQLTAADADQRLNELAQIDVRNDYNRYVYQPSVNRQFSAAMRGGSLYNTFALSVGLDNNTENLVENGLNRFTINNNNTFRPLRNLEITTGISYVNTIARLNNQYHFASPLTNYTGTASLYPYASLANGEGNPMPVVNTYRSAFVDSMQTLGFLNWQLNPLNEIQMADYKSTTQHLLLRSSARYNFTKSFNLQLNFQHEKQQRIDRNLRSPGAYYVRDWVNKFTVRNTTTGALTHQFPKGSILDLNNVNINANNLRIQGAFNKQLGLLHQVNAIAGTELRERILEGYAHTAYGYNDEYGTAVTNINYQLALPVQPSGTATIPAPPASVSGTINRYISYYTNASYTYRSRYTFSASGRSDGANIFGVRTNQKMVPLWSAGLAWNINQEAFYKTAVLPVLKARITYGYNGNTYEGNAFLTAQYATQFNLTGQPYGTVTAPPNPLLRWEKVKNINFGLDFESKNGVMSGSLDWYTKKGLDLIEDAPLPPSSGFASFKGNAAETLTKGIDLILTTKLGGQLFKWENALLFNYNSDKVITFNTKYLPSNIAAGTGGLMAVVGNPLFGIYSFPWSGIDPANGDPLGMLDGKASSDYVKIIANTKPEDLVFHGSARPTIFGAFRNSFAYKSISLSFNITGKFGYYFRKRSISLNYQDVVNAGGNADYYLRWQKPGDEMASNVPSLAYPSNANRNNFYQFASVLVYKGDHFRLQDIQCSFHLGKKTLKGFPFAKAEIYSYINNLGLLWKQNKAGLDPDYNDRVTGYPDPRSIAFGIRLNP